MRPMLALALQCAGRMTARHPLMLADPNGAPSSPWEKLVAWWDEDPDAVEVATELLDALLRDDGWIIRCEIGTDAARDAGGTGRLATRADASACASVDAAVAFDAESGYEPPQGSVRLLVPSRLLGEGRSFWKLEEVDERGVPKFVKWRVECPAGIQASGDELVPPGPLYFDAKCARGRDGAVALRMYDGLITIKEEVGADVPGLFRSRGILAEFKVVGTFSAVPAPPAGQTG